MTQTKTDRITRLQTRFPFLTEEQARWFLVINWTTGTDEEQLHGDDLQEYLDQALENTMTLKDEQVKQFIKLIGESFKKPEVYARQVLAESSD